MQMKKSAHCAKLFGKKIPAAFIKKVVASPASALVEATNHHLRSSLDFIISFKFKWQRLFLAHSRRRKMVRARMGTCSATGAGAAAIGHFAGLYTFSPTGAKSLGFGGAQLLRLSAHFSASCGVWI